MPPLPQASYGQLGPGEIQQLHPGDFFGGYFSLEQRIVHSPTVEKYFPTGQRVSYVLSDAANVVHQQNPMESGERLHKLLWNPSATFAHSSQPAFFFGTRDLCHHQRKSICARSTGWKIHMEPNNGALEDDLCFNWSDS